MIRPAVMLLSAATIVFVTGDASAGNRRKAYFSGPGYYPMQEGRSAWVAGRTRAGAACTIYSCPRTTTPGVPLKSGRKHKTRKYTLNTACFHR